MIRTISSFILLSTLLSCSRSYTPKPKGQLRIEFPSAQYAYFNEDDLPYAFAVSHLAVIEMLPNDSAAYWLNIDYPALNAKIYCSYKSITPGTLDEYTTESRRLVERAVKQAAAITEKAYENSASGVYGMFYAVEGETASPVQFWLTDSVSHFFRGALYYRHKTDPDSIAPVTDYIKNDVTELIQTFYWKK
ncbi:MAG: gliding motility protein GldD [Tannerella sp.]|nr:gliding motility protein GldD [Tannerella sp.]